MVRHLSLSSSPHWRSSPSSLPLPLPRLLLLGACRPFPLLPLLSLSLLCAPPSPPAWWPHYATLLLAVSHFRLLLNPPPPTSSGSASSFFIWSRGGCGCPASFWGYLFPGSLDCYARASPSPASAWPPSYPPAPFEPSPLGDTADPLLLASSHGFQGVVPVPLAPRLLLWPWCLRAPPTVVFASAFVHCFL